jgi:GT2 family glycosyltransferase
MARTVGVAVIIPTYQRGDKICSVLEQIFRCDPLPSEVWVHADRSDGRIEAELSNRFPDVRVIGSTEHVGPGGGRRRCLLQCSTPFVVSFDDDSYAVDRDFFERVVTLFNSHPDAAILGATIWLRGEVEVERRETLHERLTYAGCGHAMRLSAYRDIKGYIPRPIAYGVEENDVSLQLFAKGYKIYESGELRVFHDTKLEHHRNAAVVECVVANVALLAFLRYPVWLWSLGALQLASIVVYCLRVGRWRGVAAGLMRIPADCLAFRPFRETLPSKAVIAYLQARRALR